jgi:hypothetical protein
LRPQGEFSVVQIGANADRDRKRPQFLRDVVVHIVVTGPGLLGRIDVETGTEAEIVFAVGIVGHVAAARACVGRHQQDAELGRDALRTALHHEVLFRAGQTGEERDDRHIARSSLWRYEHGKPHIAVIGVGRVSIKADTAAEATGLAERLDGHGDALLFQSFWNTSVALVPPKPKLFDMAVLIPASWIVSVTGGISASAGSRSNTLIDGAMKSCSSISRQ